MLLKYPELQAHLTSSAYLPLYIVAGSDPYLIQKACMQIKNAYKNRRDCAEYISEINTPSDWNNFLQLTNSYSLFDEYSLIDAHLNKKSLDNNAKKTLTQYLADPNPECLALIRAPHLNTKKLLWLTNNPKVIVTQADTPVGIAFTKFIQNLAKINKLQINQQAIEFLAHHTQGNSLAAAQLIEKLSINFDTNKEITARDIQPHLTNQTQFQLYELADAILVGNVNKSLHILHRQKEQRTEAILVLWIITQEVRQLLKINHLLQQSISFANSCRKLNIWTSKIANYEKAIKRLDFLKSCELLQQCKQIDNLLRSSDSQRAWQLFEKIIVFICK